MRRLAVIAATLAAIGAGFATTATGDDSKTYFIELDNAFGLVNGSEVKVAGVPQGTIEQLFINSDKRAVLKVTLSGPLSELGEDTVCSSEPQSLIAEYFIDCVPKGEPLAPGEGTDAERMEEPDIPVEQTRQTVQTDLVQSALRMPFRQRLQVIINEFGTALAGNPENLNAAIRRGAPALEAAKKVTGVLADQNRIIRDLNADSDQIVAQLNDRREDVVRFIENAGRTAEASAAERDALSQDFAKLDDFLAELEPTMVDLNDLAVTQTPLLRDLRLSGPGLARLSRDLPDFNRAGTKSLVTLGEASEVGERALRDGKEEIRQLANSSKKAFSVADNLAKFLRDIDDPRRAVEIDARVEESTGRSSSRPGTKNTMGYTGMEGLLNYVFYQAGAISQFDQVSHLLHFSIFEVATGPCAEYNAGPTLPSVDGGDTTDPAQANRCVGILGDNQPGINTFPEVAPYDPSVCPEGSTDLSICDPNGASSAARDTALTRSAGDAADVRGAGGAPDPEAGTPAPGDGTDPGGGDAGTTVPDGDPGDDAGASEGDSAGGAGSDVGDRLDGILDSVDGLGKGLGLRERLERGKSRAELRRSVQRASQAGSEATSDLLNFLLAD